MGAGAGIDDVVEGAITGAGTAEGLVVDVLETACPVVLLCGLCVVADLNLPVVLDEVLVVEELEELVEELVEELEELVEELVEVLLEEEVEDELDDEDELEDMLTCTNADTADAKPGLA